ncbi:MAG: TldD/PmbA family protein [Actinobacteria bacterium]|nr:TldD/PmbA family protein [Actinomycetota bacterium]
MKSSAARNSLGPASPLQVARTVLARGRRVGADLEVYVQFGRTVNIKVFGREVEAVAVAEPRGLGVRAVRDGRVGYACTSDLGQGGLDRVLAQAVDNLRAADADPYADLPEVPPRSYPVVPDLWHAGVSGTSLEAKTKIALEAEAAALAVPEIEVVEESVYSDEEARVAIASTKGIEAEAEQSFCFGYVVAHAGHGGDRQSGLGFCLGRDPATLDSERAGRDAAERASALLGARPCPTGSYAVVFDSEVAAALLASVVQALSADAVQKGRSVLAGRLGEAVASPLLTLYDDGLAARGMATNPFDGEGVPQQKTTLFENGILRSYLHSSYTARKEDGEARSTGNAGRGSYRSLPGVTATNLIVRPGEGDLAHVMARVGEGLYVDSVAGLHSGVNPVSGEISVGATGRLIEGGAAGRPVREVTIATDFLQFLSSVSDLGGDARWIPLHGSVRTPSVAVQGIAVSGT